MYSSVITETEEILPMLRQKKGSQKEMKWKNLNNDSSPKIPTVTKNVIGGEIVAKW